MRHRSRFRAVSVFLHLLRGYLRHFVAVGASSYRLPLVLADAEAQTTPSEAHSAPADTLAPLEFRDYDCLALPPSRLLENRRWSEWLDIFETNPASQWITASHPFLQIIDRLELQEWGALRRECPFGFASFLSVYLMQCMLQTRRGKSAEQYAEIEGAEKVEAVDEETSCYLSFQVENLFSSVLNQYPPRILFGTRWPILTILSARNLFTSFLAQSFWNDAEKNCLHLPNPVANWRKLQKAFWIEDLEEDPGSSEQQQGTMIGATPSSKSPLGSARKPNKEWYLPSLNFVFHSKLKNGAGSTECPLGYFFVELLRSFTSMTSESRFFLAHEPAIKQLFATQDRPGFATFILLR
eukprot:g5090.t1